MKKIFTLFSAASVIALSASAQRLLTEDFNYSAGQLTTVSGGAWVNFSGTGYFIPVSSGNLSYPNYVTSPNGSSGKISIVSASSSAEDDYSAFATTSSGTLYASFLVNISATNNLYDNTSTSGEYFFAFLPSTSTSAYSGRVMIRQGTAANTFNLGIAPQSASSTAVAWIGTDFSAGTTHLITAAYQFVDGANNDVVKLWVDEATSATEPAPMATTTFTAGTEPADLGRIAFRQGSTNTPNADIDAIKVSTSWADATLPVSLQSFSVVERNGFAVLSWTTTNEINMKNYVVEKSADAHVFAEAGSVEAKNSITANAYTFTDLKALSGTAYYRLRMVNKDNTASYSGIVSITGKSSLTLSVFPNPVQNSLTVSHPKAIAGATLQVVSFDGKKVATYSVQPDAIQTSVNIAHLNKGNYFVVFANGKQVQTTKFLKQ